MAARHGGHCAGGAGVAAVAVPGGLVPEGSGVATAVADSVFCGSGGAGGSDGEKSGCCASERW
jgi:hypothetical protein